MELSKLKSVSGNKNSIPLVRTETSHDKLPIAKKRKVEMSIEYHITEDVYLLVIGLPVTAKDTIVINKDQAESLIKTFKLIVINIK